MNINDLQRYIDKGTSLYKEDKFEESMIFYEKAIQLAEQNEDLRLDDTVVTDLYTTAIYNISVAAIKLERHKESIEIIKSKLPNIKMHTMPRERMGNVLYNMAFSYYREDKIANAYIYLKQAKMLLGEDRECAYFFAEGVKGPLNSIIVNKIKEISSKK